MERSLTILLPVHNVQTTLAADVRNLLEVVSELTERFELIIIDDGSTDATSEVACDLGHDFPQIRVVCHGRQLGRDVAIHTGLQHSKGEYFLLPDETAGSAVGVVAEAWRTMRQQMRQLISEHPMEPSGARRPRLSEVTAGADLGCRVLDRRAMERLHGASRPARPNYLSQLQEVALNE